MKKEACMKRKTTITAMVALVVFFGLSPGRSVLAGDLGLIDLLTKDLGVTEHQAQAGAGAIFNLAKEKLSVEDFGKVAGAVPEMDGLLEAAPSTSGLGGTLGSKTSLLGGGAEKAGGLAGLAGTFSGLGLDSGMVGKFVPIVLSYVESKGGESVKNILAGVLQ
jgi:hypothetical protein